MGKAAPLLLDALNIDFLTIQNTADLEKLGTFIKKTFEVSRINAAFLSRELWHEAK